MATLLHRLGTAAFRRWPVVVAAWLLVVIGAGMAGVAAANKCAAQGWRVAIVDELPYGGTCALRGCDPNVDTGRPGHASASALGQRPVRFDPDDRARSGGEHRQVEAVPAADVDHVEPGQDVQQGGLSLARGAHDRGELAAADAHVHGVQRGDGARSGAVGAGHPAGDDRRSLSGEGGRGSGLG